MSAEGIGRLTCTVYFARNIVHTRLSASEDWKDYLKAGVVQFRPTPSSVCAWTGLCVFFNIQADH